MSDEEKDSTTLEERPREHHVRRKITFDVNATPLGASASDFVFAKSDEWTHYRKENGKLVFSGPPGTWYFYEGGGILTCCPKCRTVSFLHPAFSEVKPDGAVHVKQSDGQTVHSLRCGAKDCGWGARAYLDQAWGKTLYAIAVFNRRKQKRGKDPREIHYAAANSQEEALTQVVLEGECTVIAVGPAIGFQVIDKHGERIVAEG